VVPSLDVHPLPAMLDAGVPCSLNADDPLLFCPTLLEEYELCRDQFGFDDARLADLARTSFEFSGAPEAVKQFGVEGVDGWLSG
jgi:adenosine deaminase